MSIKLLANKAGALQGLDADGIARQSYGRTAKYLADEETWPGYIGAIVIDSHLVGEAPGSFVVLDRVLSIHEVKPE